MHARGTHELRRKVTSDYARPARVGAWRRRGPAAGAAHGFLATLCLLFATPAWAAVYNVTHDSIMTRANAQAIAPSEIIISNGTYTVAPNPTNNGTGVSTRITYVGNLASPNSVILPGFDMTKSYITVKGCSLTTTAVFRSSNGSATQQVFDSLYLVRGAAGYEIRGVNDVVVSNCRFWGGGGAIFEGSAEAPATTHRTLRTSVLDVTHHDVLIGAFSYMLRQRNQALSTFTRCTWYGKTTLAAQDSRGWFLFHSDNNTFTDCRWDFEAEVGTETGSLSQNWVTLRDSSKFGAMVRCTLYAGLQSQMSRTCDLFASGTVTASNDYWTIKNCVFKAWSAHWLVQDFADGWDMQGNTFASRLGKALYFVQPMDSTIFRHNTVYSGAGHAMSNDKYWTGGTASRRHQNIFYSKTQPYSGPSCQEDETVWREANSGAAPTTFASDSNLVWAVNNDSTNWLCNTSSGRMDANSDAGWGLDVKSRWGTPTFADTTWATLNLTPSSTGFASGAWWPDGYAGALSTAAPDVTPPANITDLTFEGSASSSTIDMSWSAVGDDGAVGTANYYVLKRSLSTITAGNFDAATTVPGTPAPAISGSPEGFTDTGLSPSTTYHYSIKAVDEAGNRGAFDSEMFGTTMATFGISSLSVVASHMSASIRFQCAPDADTSAVVRVYYGTAPSPTDTAATCVRRPGTTTYSTSLFGLTPGQPYYLRLSGVRGATTVTKDTTITTRSSRYWEHRITGPLVYISPSGNDAAAGTSAAPRATIASAYALLIAQPNKGRGGAIVLKDGTYYQRNTLDGADNFATRDTGYQIVAENFQQAIISGADPRVTQTPPTWAAAGAVNNIYGCAYAGADSMRGMWNATQAYHRCTSMTELIQGTGTGGGGTWTYNAYNFFSNGADSLYARAAGVSPSGIRVGYRNDLLWILDPYIRVTGIVFENAGGFTRNGIAIRISTGGSPNWRAAGVVVDSCQFRNLNREGIYSYSDTTGYAWNDSCVVAFNSFSGGGIDKMGYAAGKSRDEENVAGVFTDGSAWMIYGNTFTGLFNGLGITGGPYRPDRGNDYDVAANTITNIADDGIELDVSYGANGRIWLNRIDRTNNGMSLAPLIGGPLWVLYNTISRVSTENIGGGAFKLGTGNVTNSLGYAFIAHNTCFNDSLTSAAGAYEVGVFNNVHFRNNILTGLSTWLPIRSTLASGSFPGSATNDFNYNLLYAWGGGANKALWHNTARTAATLVSALGWEANGRFTNPVFGDTTGTSFTAAGAGVDVAQRLAGINDNGQFVTRVGVGSDMGASEFDNVRPAVNVLALLSISSRQVGLVWADSGDDSLTAVATTIDIRASSAGAITDANWSSATQGTGEPAPNTPGSSQAYTFRNLTPSTTYWFAMRTVDDVGNPSALSNVISVTTRAAVNAALAEGK